MNPKTLPEFDIGNPLYQTGWLPSHPRHNKSKAQLSKKHMQTLTAQLQSIRQINKELLTFKQIIHSSPNPILITNHRIQIVYVNPAWELLTGYRFDEIAGKNPRFLQSGKTPKEIYEVMFTYLKQDKAFISNRIIDKRKNGTEYQLHSAVFPIYLGHRKQYFVQVSHDITYQKSVEAAKDELNKRIATILDSISDGFISFDNEWRFTYINRKGEKMFPQRKESVMGKNVWRVYPKLIKTPIYAKFQEAVTNQEIIKFKCKIASGKWYDIHVYPSQNGVSVYCNDITKEQEIEQRKDEFISIASHELKTPVTSISLYAQLIKKSLEQKDFDKASQFSKELDNRMLYLTELIKNLLDTKIIQSGQLTLKKTTFSIDMLISDVAKKCEETNQTHTVQFTQKAHCSIRADKNRIGEVIENLITNAIKYSPKAKAVIVKAVKTQHNLVISVQDYGIGIAKDQQSQIFNRFYRVSETNSETFSGLGLGLYISANIIKAHKGQMWVESTQEKGSTFYVSLPV